MTQPYDYHNTGDFPRIALSAVRWNAERSGVFFSAACLEDLASETLLRYYEKIAEGAGYTNGFPIPEIAKYIVLEHLRKVDPAQPLTFDELAISPSKPDAHTDHAAAVNFVMDRLPKTERRIADAFLSVGEMDRERIAEICGQTPDNVSRYLYKMKRRIDTTVTSLIHKAALGCISGSFDDRNFLPALSFCRSREHHVDNLLRIVSTALAIIQPTICPSCINPLSREREAYFYIHKCVISACLRPSDDPSFAIRVIILENLITSDDLGFRDLLSALAALGVFPLNSSSDAIALSLAPDGNLLLKNIVPDHFWPDQQMFRRDLPEILTAIRANSSAR